MFKQSALNAIRNPEIHPSHFLELYRDGSHTELTVGQEGFKEFFGDLSKSIKQISVRCSAWFRLRPPLTDVNRTRRELDNRGLTYDRVFTTTVQTVPNTTGFLSDHIARLEEKEHLLGCIHKIIPVALTRYSGYINRIDSLAQSLPDASIWTDFHHDYDETVAKDQSHFNPDTRSGTAEFGQVYRSLNDYVDCGQHLDALNARIQAHKPSRVKEQVDRLTGVIDRLHAKTKEHALSDAWRESIANDVLTLAKWVEYYAITMNQIMQATLVVRSAEKDLLH